MLRRAVLGLAVVSRRSRWQSGLITAAGKKKPSYSVFANLKD